MDGDGDCPILALPVELPRALQCFQGREHGAPRMALWIGVCKDGHQAIAGSFVDLTSMGVNAVQKTGEVALNQLVHLRRWQCLAEPGVATDIDKEDLDVLFFFLQVRRGRIRFNESLDCLRYKFGQMLPRLLEYIYLVINGLLQT